MDPSSTVAVIGLGLMGGSLVRALRATDRPVDVIAWSADGAHERAASEAVARAATSIQDAVGQADLVVLATPVGAAVALLREIAPHLRDDAVVTDVCSVKAPVVEAATRAGLGERFAGSHPMCGSHESGWTAARADLYRGARVYVVPAGADAVTRRIERLWRGLDAEPVRIEADEHDTLMARVSHVPQLLASLLAATLDGQGIVRPDLGPGARDMTRLAASDPALWTDILLHNRESVRAACEDLRAGLGRATAALADGDAEAIARLLALGRKWADRA